MKKLISVIIPCRNTEKYLPRCFSSLQNQTIGIDNLELIFLDDCSTDGTWQTLLAIESAYPNSVLAVHLDERAYPGGARNLGMKYASADYVAFLDSDDWIEPDMYEKLYQCIIQYPCDIVRCQFIRDYGETAPPLPQNNAEKKDRLLLIDSIEKRKAFLLTDSLGNTIWDKLIRADFLRDNHITFPEHTAYEDIFWVSLIYLYATHVFILEKYLYHYFVNSDSIVLKKNATYHFDYLNVNLLTWQEWAKRDFLYLYRDELACHFLNTCYLGYLKILFLRFSQIPFEQYLALKNEILSLIPDYESNPYIKTCITPMNQILLELLKRDISTEALNEIVNSYRNSVLSVAIFTATHVRFDPPSDPMYIPLHVGRASSDDLGYLGDDTGDHISLINCFYSELTGLYWIWKNYSSADYVGLCHYRRYFLNSKQELMQKADFIRILSEYDVIVSKPVLSTQTYYEHYKDAHNINDLLTVGETILRLYPDYFPYFEEIMASHEFYSGNLFVAHKTLFNQYAEWLFTILKGSSQQIDTTGYDAYHRRVYGFLSEQLLFVWVKANHLQYYECEIGFTQEKAETIALKKQLAYYIRIGNVKKAHELFSSQIKERPDILLSASDFRQELKIIFQIINICEKEAAVGQHTMLSYSSELDILIPHYLKLTEILSHLSEHSLSAEDRIYLKKNGVSRLVLQAIIDVTPAYQNISPKDLYLS